MIVMAEEFYTAEEIAQRLRLAEDTVTRLLRQGKIPGYKIEGSWRVSRDDLEKYLEQKKNTKKK